MARGYEDLVFGPPHAFTVDELKGITRVKLPTDEDLQSAMVFMAENLGRSPAPPVHPKHDGIEPCSCDEATHLRAALEMIRKLCTSDTKEELVDDVAQVANLAAQALALEPLEGDPGVYPVDNVLARIALEDSDD